MDIQISVKNLDGTEVNVVNNVQDRNDFSYVDSFGANNHVVIKDNVVIVKRISKEHTTLLSLREKEGYINIESNEGNFKINLKIVAFNIKDDMITIAYSITEDIKEINIKYLGV